MGIPARVTLRMLCTDTAGRTVGTPENRGTGHLTARHIAGLGRGIDEMVDRLHGEIKGHELDNRLQPGEGGANPNTGKTVLGNRCIDNPALTEFVQQSLTHLVGALILADFLAH